MSSIHFEININNECCALNGNYGSQVETQRFSHNFFLQVYEILQCFSLVQKFSGGKIKNQLTKIRLKLN